MKHILTEHHKAHLSALGISDIPEHLEIHPAEYDEHYETWKRTLPHASHEVLHAKVLGHAAWKQHTAKLVAEDKAKPATVIHKHEHVHTLPIRVIVTALLLLLVLLLAPKAHCQFSHINYIDVQNQGSDIGFFTAPFTINFTGAGVSCSNSAGVITCSVTGGSITNNPGGSNTQLQFNDSAAFGGIPSFTYVKATPLLTLQAGTKFSLVDTTDTTKAVQFDASGITTGTTRTVAFPDANSRTIKNGSTTGQIPIWNSSTSTFDVSDPLVQGTQAAASTTIPNPVVIGGSDYGGTPAVRVGKVDSSGNLYIGNFPASQAVTGTFFQSTQPVSAAALPLPSGASTSAKQPALGTAGSASADVLSIQGIASMTKLLVTPDSVALPANQSVNVSQINAVTPLMGNGVTGTGSQRVTIASDNTAFAVNSTLSAETTKVIGTVRNVGNVGGAFDAATGAAPPANAILAGGLGSGATGGDVAAIPIADTYKPINVSTATTTLLVTGVSGRQVRISAINLLVAGADNVALVEGTGATCGTGTAGLTGGTTAASGWNFAANGGLTIGSGVGTVIQTATTGDSVCIVTSAAVQASGGLEYAIW